MIRTLLIVVFLLIFFIITIPVAIIAFLVGLFNKNVRYSIASVFAQFAFHVIFLLTGSTLDVQGMENIPDESVLFIGNHTSYFDIIVSYITIKKKTGFVGKKELLRIPGLNWWMVLMNCMFLDRSDPRKGLEMVNMSAKLITEGTSIFIFPEGTRSRTGELGDFKEGSFKIAAKSNCPIVPVAITGTADILENHFPFIKPSKTTITFGAPIDTASLSRPEKKALGGMARASIVDLLNK